MSGAAAGALVLVGAGGAAAVAIVKLRRRNLAQQRRLEAAMNELEQLQLAFSRFAPEQVVEDIARRGLSTAAGRRDVTVLFADLQGFTAMSETLEPEQLVQVLNGYFDRMGRAIGRHDGHVSKFIGDGLLALFGALEPNPWQANDAARAALAMREELADYNRELEQAGLQPLAVGIGVHRGEVVAGVIGSHDLKEFTVIGSVVNVASRIEGLTRRHGVDILVSSTVAEALDRRFAVRELPAEQVKGVTEPVVTWAIDGFDEPGGSR